MILFIHPKKLSDFKSREPVPLKCEGCGHIFHKPKNEIMKMIKGNRKYSFDYCCKQCIGRPNAPKPITCTHCKKTSLKAAREIKRITSKNLFCSRSCRAQYYNTNKKHGCRRSKIEVWLETKLKEKYPNLKILFNNVSAINAELDICIPDLFLAFELNGIFHYEPIYGPEKLSKIKNNDNRKFQACLERGIELCVIDVSGQKRFDEKTSKKYWKIVESLIDFKLNRVGVPDES